jgi:glycosyltransferase involved in cell wall biosynthesis
LNVAADDDVLVIIPALNEEATIGHIVTTIRGLGFAVLVIDDGSIDQTAELARAAGAIVARLNISLGVGGALRTAFRIAVEHGFSAVIQCDADGQHPPAFIPALLTAHRSTGAPMVIGSRFVRTVSLVAPGTPQSIATESASTATELFELTSGKAIGLRILRRRIRRRTGANVTDPTSGFRVIAEPLLSEFAANFPATFLGDTFEAVMAAAELVGPHGITEVGVDMRVRQGGVPFATGPRAVVLFCRALLVTGRLVRPRQRRIPSDRSSTPRASVSTTVSTTPRSTVAP